MQNAAFKPYRRGLPPLDRRYQREEARQLRLYRSILLFILLLLVRSSSDAATDRPISMHNTHRILDGLINTPTHMLIRMHTPTSIFCSTS